MTIDLRSDTVTKPSKEMLEAMFSAEVGDDVFGDDPTVSVLETKAAEMFGMEAAIFCPSGTMTNQIALKAHLFSGAEVICDKYSHIYLYEGGGIASNSQSSVKLLDGEKGRITANQVKAAINNSEDIHLPLSTLVSLENTMNKGGGSIYDFSEIERIKSVCQENGLKLHLDGARLFNALVESPEEPKNYGQVFDSISICLSKGLGAPVGSLLLGNKDFIKKSRRIRKSFGGGWRQAGYLAAAGIYALDNNVDRLKLDHANAKTIGDILRKCSFVKDIMPIDTNIVIFELEEAWTNAEMLETLKAKGVLVVGFGPQLIRFVTHLDFTSEQLNLLEKVLTQIKK
ncbi:threonine aldolase [Lacihabitans sp. LS3-19]|uniref:threonine aldolase family protein n=1 Tax=Lacihabitans sp. LS3-19 TaxID=2487335 RepID=UPI0020CEB594|nr:GntG family PLP-dependent aldolase [Lacihabitans sp. LS3-19]MCP9767573.1 threonine aldolase [Lacihabitans sp. LS3-19]